MIVSLSGCQFVCAFADPTDSLTRPWHVYLTTCISIYSLHSCIYPLISLQTYVCTYTSKQLCIPILSLCSSVDAQAQYNTVQCRMYVSSYLRMPGAVWKSASFFTMACTFRMELLSYRNTYSKGEGGRERVRGERE